MPKGKGYGRSGLMPGSPLRMLRTRAKSLTKKKGKAPRMGMKVSPIRKKMVSKRPRRM